MFAGLVFIVLASKLTKVYATYDAELLSTITLSFADEYYISCIVSLYNEKISMEEKMGIFKVQESLVAKSFKTCGIYPFEQYIAIRSSYQYRYHKRACHKSMKLLFATKEGKNEFTHLTRHYPMADSLWLVFFNSSIDNFFDDSRLPFNMQLIAVNVMNPDLVELHEVYRVDDGFPTRMVYFGTWTRADGLKVIKGHIYTRRSDLEGKVIRTGSTENWPMTFTVKGRWDGYYIRIWRHLEEAINTTSVHFQSVDNATGMLTSDGKWTGVVGMVLDDKVDLAATEMNINRERSYAIDFLHPLFFSRHQVFFKRSDNWLEWSTIFKPFPPSVWFCIIAWILIASVALAFSCNRSYISGIDIAKNKYDFVKSFFFLVQTFCMQGCGEVPKSVGSRIVYFFAYLLPTIMIPAYSASLISSLTVKAPIPPFDSFEQMVKDGTFKLIVPNNTAEYVQFANASEPIYKEAFQKLVYVVPEDDLIASDSNLIERFLCQKSKYSLYAVEAIFKMKIEKSDASCTVVKLNEELDHVQQSMGLKKNSPFTGLFNYHLQKMSEAGLMKRIQRAIWLRDPEPKIGKFREVILKDVSQIFVFLLFAIVVSIWILVIEKITFKWKMDKNKEKKSDKLFSKPRLYAYVE